MDDMSNITPNGEEVKPLEAGSCQGYRPGEDATTDEPIENGGPAFPLPIPCTPAGHYATYESAPGMSLRDYFAGQALAGMEIETAFTDGDEERGLPVQFANRYARYAYIQADAMLKARGNHVG
jgi:hypothetical protein